MRSRARSGWPRSTERLDRTILAGSVACLAATCWLIMLAGHADGATLLHPHHGLTGAAGFGAAFVMWMVMMVGMMLPPVMPWIMLFASTSRDRDASRAPYASTFWFTSGYFAVWAGFSGAAAAMQVALDERALLDGPAMRTEPLVGGVLLVAAGAFQLTPLKTACLKHCRTPLSFFVSRWRDGPVGAFRMGAGHGAVCVTCCWALMLVSFALGLMNLLWMGALTLFLCAEKIAPHGAWLGRIFGAALLAWGAWLLAG